MRDHGHEVGPGLVDGTQLLQLSLRLGVEPALLDEAGEQARERFEELDISGTEVAVFSGLDVEHTHHLLLPHQRNRAERGQAVLVDTADPGEPIVIVHVGTDDGDLRLGREPGDALPHLETSHAHRVLVEPVGRGQRQAAAVSIADVERADIRV